MNEVNKQLKDNAIMYGLCQQWQDDWKTEKSTFELIDMYKRGLDFVIQHDYPSVDFIKKNFDMNLLNENLVFVDNDIHVVGSSGIYVINGACSGNIAFDNFNVATINVRHNSEISIKAKGLSKVFIRVFDNAIVHVSQSEAAKVYVYKRSENCKVQTEGDVLER